MRGCDDDVDGVQLTPTTTTAINYSDDEILQDSAVLVVDDVSCVDAASVGTAPRRKSADYGCGSDRRACFAPYSKLDVEHHPLDVQRHDVGEEDGRQVDRRLATLRSYDDRPPDAVSSRLDDDHFTRTTSTTHAVGDADTVDGCSIAAASSRDSVHHGNDDVSRWCGRGAVVSSSRRRRFMDEQLAHYERPVTTRATTNSVIRVSTPYVRSISDHSEFVVRPSHADRFSTPSSSSSSSSSSPATRLVGRSAPRTSPAVDLAVIPPSHRLPPTSLKAPRNCEQTDRSAAAAATGLLRRSNSVAGGSSGGRSLQSGDEGFADSRTARTPSETRRMSGGGQGHSAEACCQCRVADCRRVTAAGSQTNVSAATSDQARKRSYRVGLNLFNKYVLSRHVYYYFRKGGYGFAFVCLAATVM